MGCGSSVPNSEVNRINLEDQVDTILPDGKTPCKDCDKDVEDQRDQTDSSDADKHVVVDTLEEASLNKPTQHCVTGHSPADPQTLVVAKHSLGDCITGGRHDEREEPKPIQHDLTGNSPIDPQTLVVAKNSLGGTITGARHAEREEPKRTAKPSSPLLPMPDEVKRLTAKDKDFKYDSEEHDLLVKNSVKWLINALVSAHSSKEIKTAARRLLAEPAFTLQLKYVNVWEELMTGLKEHLQEMGEPLKRQSEYYCQELNSGILKIGLSKITAGDPQGVQEGSQGQARLDCQGFLQLPKWNWDDPVTKWEEAWIHVIRLVALALNPQFKLDMETKLKGSGASEVAVAPIKSFTRMRNKMQAIDDHRFARLPRPSRNVDVNRTLAVVEDELAMKRLCERCSEEWGLVKVKNGFDLSPEEAFNIFELRVMMLTLRYDSGRTYGQLATDNGVKEIWRQYRDEEAESGIPATRWKKHVQKAIEFLQSPEIKHVPVVTMVEVQAILRPYYEVRQDMHELYKAFRAENQDQLLADFERCFQTRSHAKSPEAQNLLEDPDNLFDAAEWDQPEAIISLLLAGAEIDEPDTQGYTPLLIGVDHGHVAVVKTLVDSGAKSLDTPIRDPSGEQMNTPLLLCAQKGFADIAKILVDAGAKSFDVPDKDGVTPLLWCAQEGHADVAKILVEAGAKSLDVPDKHGVTPLMWCADLGFVGVAQVLIDGGAQAVNAAGKDKLTPLLLCAQRGFLDVALVLIRGRWQNGRNIGGGADLQSGLEYARRSEDAPKLAFLEKLQDIMQATKPWRS